jgi:hypothetical protein
MSDQHTRHGPAPHRIRLQAVWDPPSPGGETWRRQFGRPAGIEPGIRVVLVVEEPAVMSLMLNGAALSLNPAAGSRWTHDVTDLLQDRNEMLLVPAADEPSRGWEVADAPGRVSLPVVVGRVSLEILTPPRADR